MRNTFFEEQLVGCSSVHRLWDVYSELLQLDTIVNHRVPVNLHWGDCCRCCYRAGGRRRPDHRRNHTQSVQPQNARSSAAVRGDSAPRGAALLSSPAQVWYARHRGRHRALLQPVFVCDFYRYFIKKWDKRGQWIWLWHDEIPNFRNLKDIKSQMSSAKK